MSWLAVRASYYDGRSSRPWSVTLRLRDRALVVSTGDAALGEAESETIVREEPLDAVKVTEMLGSAPRRVQFSDGAFCEVRDLEGLAALLAQSGHREGLVSRLQRHAGVVAISLIASVGITVSAFVWGLPAAAQFATAQLPPSVDRRIGEHVLKALDHGIFLPSKLDEERQAAIEARFAQIAGRASHESDVVFRSAPAIGPNALTLPDGTIVLLDQLVQLLDDDEIVAVLAHELGHAQRRHPLRMLLQGSAIATFWTVYVGDVSSLLAIAPTAMLQARYSRVLEQEADAFAVDTLESEGLSPALLADALEKLEASEENKKGRAKHEFSYLDSHPATVERIERLRKAAGGKPRLRTQGHT